MIRIKRAYHPPGPSDGRRILVDRLWPRGLSKEAARIDAWLKDVAPNDALRRWFGHDPRRWIEFKRRYRDELQEKTGEIKGLAEEARLGTVTLLYGARDEKHNNAVALKELLEQML